MVIIKASLGDITFSIGSGRHTPPLVQEFPLRNVNEDKTVPSRWKFCKRWRLYDFLHWACGWNITGRSTLVVNGCRMMEQSCCPTASMRMPPSINKRHILEKEKKKHFKLCNAFNITNNHVNTRRMEHGKRQIAILYKTTHSNPENNQITFYITFLLLLLTWMFGPACAHLN